MITWTIIPVGFNTNIYSSLCHRLVLLLPLPMCCRFNVSLLSLFHSSSKLTNFRRRRRRRRCRHVLAILFLFCGVRLSMRSMWSTKWAFLWHMNGAPQSQCNWFSDFRSCVCVCICVTDFMVLHLLVSASWAHITWLVVSDSYFAFASCFSLSSAIFIINFMRASA